MERQKRILLIGRNPTVLHDLALALRQESFQVDATSKIDTAAEQIDALAYDLIAFGRGIDEPTNRSLRTVFAAVNPDLRFVNGLAPVIPLLVKQIKAALWNKADNKPAGILLLYDPTQPASIQVSVTNPGHVTVTLYQLDAIHATSEIRLIDEKVAAGVHQFNLPKSIDTVSYNSFLVAETDDMDMAVLPL